MKKKIIAILLTAVMAASLFTGCGAAKNQEKETAAPASEKKDEIIYSDVNDIEAYENETYDPAKDAADYRGEPFAEQKWYFSCSGDEDSIEAKAGRYFASLMNFSSEEMVTVKVNGTEDRKTDGDPVGGISALIQGSRVDVSMHSNLVYSKYDSRFAALSLPGLFADNEAVDQAAEGSIGETMTELLAGMGLHCFGIAEKGFHQLQTTGFEVTEAKNLSGKRIQIPDSDLIGECCRCLGVDAVRKAWAANEEDADSEEENAQENALDGADVVLPIPQMTGVAVKDSEEGAEETEEVKEKEKTEKADAAEEENKTNEAETSEEAEEAAAKPTQSLLLWNAYYEGLFFCMNQNTLEGLTEEQIACVEENAQKTIAYQKLLVRHETEQQIAAITKGSARRNGAAVTLSDVSALKEKGFRKALTGLTSWYEETLISEGIPQEEAKSFIAAFTK